MLEHQVDYRTLVLKKEKEDRPQFERLMSDLERARQHWDTPGLRDYARVLMKIVGRIALVEAGDVVKDIDKT